MCKWSESEVAALIEQRSAGNTPKTIAERLGIPVEKVRAKLKRLAVRAMTPDSVMLLCIRCGRMFQSTGHRLCKPCTRHAARNQSTIGS